MQNALCLRLGGLVSLEIVPNARTVVHVDPVVPLRGV